MSDDVIKITGTYLGERRVAFIGILPNAAARHGLSVPKLIDYIANGWELPITHRPSSLWTGPYIAEIVNV